MYTYIYISLPMQWLVLLSHCRFSLYSHYGLCLQIRSRIILKNPRTKLNLGGGMYVYMRMFQLALVAFTAYAHLDPHYMPRPFLHVLL